MSPLLSIVIPTFNRPAYLKEAALSALGQTYPNIEVVIGDNGTTDARRDWEPELANDPRLIYRRNERNLGMVGNFNALADAARGEYLVALGDDDRLLPDFASRLMAEMKPDVRLVFCNHYLIDSHGARLEAESREQTRHYGRYNLRTGVLESPQIAAWQQAIAISAAIMRTEDMQRLRFQEDLDTPDAEYFIRLSQEGGSFVFLPDYLAEYRVHAAGSSSSLAGLCSERLVEYLIPMEVAPGVEPYKRKLLGPLIMNAVSRCLQRGERDRARKFLRSSYYPRRAPTISDPSATNHAHGIRGQGKRLAEETEHAVKSGLQHLCASLPGPIGSPTYRVVRAAKDWAGL